MIRLTPRETQLIGLLSQGATNGEIAKKMTIKLRTAKNKVRELGLKIMPMESRRTRTALAIWWIKQRR
jgi:DNA-binding NarL/FixJ family response regulator